AIHPETRDIYVTGTTNNLVDNGAVSQGAFDVFVSKISNGRLEWSRQFGSPQDDIASALIINKEGHVAVSGLWSGNSGFVQIYHSASAPLPPPGNDQSAGGGASAGLAVVLILLFGAALGSVGYVYIT